MISKETEAAFKGFPLGWGIKDWVESEDENGKRTPPPGWEIVDGTSRLAKSILRGEVGIGAPFTLVLRRIETQPGNQDGS